MAEFGRDYKAGVNGFPQANMFHQPDLEELLFARVQAHPLITFHRGAEVTGLDGTAGTLGSGAFGAGPADPSGPTGPVRRRRR